MQIFDAQSAVAESRDANKTLYKAIITCTWLLGVSVASGAFFIGFPMIVKVQTIFFCTVATISLLCVCLVQFFDKDQPEFSNDKNAANEDNDAGDAIKIETTHQGEFVSNDEIDLLIKEKRILIKKVLFFSTCVIPGGMYRSYVLQNYRTASKF